MGKAEQVLADIELKFGRIESSFLYGSRGLFGTM
jgi:hypothetical protein